MLSIGIIIPLKITSSKIGYIITKFKIFFFPLGLYPEYREMKIFVITAIKINTTIDS
ncbi:Protein of unknown function [Bacillus wiedmannii]|nr:Protein of unknown function [Bacillus wiedmannii]